MQSTKNDNRMLWVRNLDWLANTANPILIECELGSEAEITGLLNFGGGAILCAGCTDRPDDTGLYKYILKLRIGNGPNPRPEATRRGYVFNDGPWGELTALMSSFFEVRFYMLSMSSSELTTTSIKSKREFAPIRRNVRTGLDPVVFDQKARNFAQEFPSFLLKVSSLDAKYHYPIITAFAHYSKALREIGIDEEMVFVRLVSAVEAVSAHDIASDDIFDGRSLDSLLRKELSTAERDELETIFAVRKAQKKFVAFLERNANGFFKGGRRKVPHASISRSKLPAICKAIYNARSLYLHAGEPMHLSPVMQEPQRGWDIDPGGSSTLQDKLFTAGEKLPYPDFFHRLVRHCLMNYVGTILAEVPGRLQEKGARESISS
jgi:hypothetical protein